MARVDEQDAEDPAPGQPTGSSPLPPGSPYQTQAASPLPPGSPYQTQAVNQYPAPVLWSTNLFDCHLDQTNSVMTTILPCMTFGQIAEVLDEGEMTCPLGSFIYLLMMPALCSSWVFGSKYRTKLRKKYNLVEAPYEDTMSHLLCPCCSLCQEYRELKIRGLDPALGWNGILAQQSGVQQYQRQQPPQYQTMS